MMIRVNRAMYLVAALVSIDRQRAECLRNAFHPGKYESGQDGKDDGSFHGFR